MSDWIVQDEIPASGRGVYSELHADVDKLIATPELVGKAVCIASYEEGEDGAGRQKATSAVQSLRQKYGMTSAVLGLRVSAAKVRRNGDTEDRRGVWVQYLPDTIVDGELAKHQQKMKEAGEKQQAAKKAKDLAAKKEKEKAARATAAGK